MLTPQTSLGLSITVSAETLEAARRSIHGCVACSENAEIPLVHLLDRLTGHFGAGREYMLDADLCCPRCSGSVDDNTLIEIQLSAKAAAA